MSKDKYNPITKEHLKKREDFDLLNPEDQQRGINLLHEQGLIENVDRLATTAEKESDLERKEELELVLKVCETIKEKGGIALAVGGFARDTVLNKFGYKLKPKDIDIEVYGIEHDNLLEILKNFGSIDIVGDKFQVFKLNGKIDVSIPRRDSKTGKGHKGFKVEGDPNMLMREAARRRDFTINALALDPLTGEIFDFYGGVEDIKNKTIRATDKETFVEDPLRVLRAMQFAGRFGFNIDKETIELCKTLDLKGELSKERIGEEWLKLLEKAPKPSVGMEYALELGILDQLHPELKALIGVPQNPEYHPEGDVWTHTKLVVDAAVAIASERGLSGEDKRVLILAALCHDLGKSATTETREDGKITSYGHEEVGLEPAQKFLDMLFVHKDVSKRVLSLVKHHMFPHHKSNADSSDALVKRLANKLDPATIEDLVYLSTADARGSLRIKSEYEAAENLLKKAKELGVEKTKPKPLIMGQDLLEIGFKPGPIVGKILKEIRELQLDGTIIDLGQAKEYGSRRLAAMESKDRFGLSIVIERGKIEELKNLPPRSIALDGYVQGPEFDLENQRFSFDHHDKVSRQITRATCQQIMDSGLLGSDFKDYTIYINDIDGDTVLSVWLLKHPEKVNDPQVRMLVESVGGTDAHGPAYEAMDPDMAEKFYRAVMRPESDSRRNKEYAKADLYDLLESCLANLDTFIEGKLEYVREEKDERTYEIIKKGKTGWVMAESDDFIFDLLYKAGYTKAVACQKQPDGTRVYTVAKKSDMVGNFPVGPPSIEGTILYGLNKVEPGWGGGSNIGGAPRNLDGSRSRLLPEEVFEIIESVANK